MDGSWPVILADRHHPEVSGDRIMPVARQRVFGPKFCLDGHGAAACALDKSGTPDKGAVMVRIFGKSDIDKAGYRAMLGSFCYRRGLCHRHCHCVVVRC